MEAITILIQEFKIKKLFGSNNVDLKFSNKTTIYIGENGIGKTTVLTIFYYVLTLNFKKLLRYDFEEIIVKIQDQAYMIKKNDIDRILKLGLLDRNLNGEIPFAKLIQETVSIGSYQSICEDNISSSDLDKVYYKVKEKVNVPREIFDQGITDIKRLKEYQQIVNYSSLMRKQHEKYEIIYYPTYRRIEEEASELNYIVDRRQRIEPGYDPKKDEKDIGILIHFGMLDVKENFDKILHKITRDSIENFNNMTLELLEQYSGNELNTKINNEDIIKFDIALHRMNPEISEDKVNKIIDEVRNDSAENGKYLKNLVWTIVNNYKKISDSEKRIENFVDVCNKYLMYKQLNYDPKKIILKIITHNGKEIELDQLSSGEKQLISVFSKVILEEKKRLIVLFDEPELSLSLNWQKKFIYDLSKVDRCDLIVAMTHSPFIFDRLFDNTFDLESFIDRGEFKK